MDYNVTGENIFVTGGAGFIGSTLIGRLIERNKVTVYDNFQRNALKEKSFLNHPNLTLIQGDVLDLDKLKKSISDSTYVIHAAGIAGIDTVIKRPVDTLKVNMVGSVNVLEAAVAMNKCKRVICFSTSEVFGQVAFRSEETSPTVMGAVGEARWTYAVSKLAEEHLAYAYYKESGLPTVTVRPFNIYGPGQVGEGAIRTFIKRALQNETLYIHGDGSQIRAWCYIDDMVDGVLSCMVNDQAVGESFNIGNERAVITIYGLANTIIRILGSQSTVEFVDSPSPDIELRIPRVGKAKKILNFQAKIDLEEGIVKTAEFYRNYALTTNM